MDLVAPTLTHNTVFRHVPQGTSLDRHKQSQSVKDKGTAKGGEGWGTAYQRGTANKGNGLSNKLLSKA